MHLPRHPPADPDGALWRGLAGVVHASAMWLLILFMCASAALELWDTPTADEVARAGGGASSAALVSGFDLTAPTLAAAQSTTPAAPRQVKSIPGPGAGA